MGCAGNIDHRPEGALEPKVQNTPEGTSYAFQLEVAMMVSSARDRIF